MELPRKTQLTVSRQEAWQRYRQLGFRQHFNYVDLSTEWWRWLVVTAFYSRGRDVNFYPAARVAPFLGNSADAILNLTFRPGSRLRLDQMYYYTALRTREFSPFSRVSRPAAVFNSHLIRTKANYQFTRAWSVRTVLDYDAMLANSTLAGQRTSKRLRLEAFLTYMMNPGTTLHLGYTDRYENLVLDPMMPGTIRPIPGPTQPVNRRFVVKISYLIRR